nr:hypothetical protein CFP56_73112 [Quercus suber]
MWNLYEDWTSLDLRGPFAGGPTSKASGSLSAERADGNFSEDLFHESLPFRASLLFPDYARLFINIDAGDDRWKIHKSNIRLSLAVALAPSTFPLLWASKCT